MGIFKTNIFTFGLILSLLAIILILPAYADDPKARGIMEKVDAREDGDNSTADMEMVLIDKKGSKRFKFEGGKKN